jgi:hypothetical protein
MDGSDNRPAQRPVRGDDGRTLRQPAADHVRIEESQMIRKVSLSLAVAVGVFWLASTFAFGYPYKTQAVDNLTNSFRPAFTNSALAQSKADLSVATNFGTDFQNKAVPALAEKLNLTPEQFVQAVSTQYPAVGHGLTQLPQILTYFHTVQQTMAGQQHNFHEADAIPTKSLPNTTVHWLFVVLGIAAVGVGVGGFVLRRRFVGVVAAVLGIGVIATTLILSVPGKTRAVDEMTEAFRPIFTTQSATVARGYVSTLQAMDKQLTTQALPGLAGMLNVTPQQLGTTLATDFPAIATGLQQMPAILGRIDALVTAVGGNVQNFQLANAVPTTKAPATAVEWQFVIPASLLIVAGVGAFAGTTVGTRSRRAKGAAAPERLSVSVDN